MPNIKLKFNARLLAVLVGLLLLAEVIGGYRGWRIFLVGLGGAWILAYLWARSLATGLRIRRELRFGWLQVGDRMLDRITLSQEGRFPALWIEVKDDSTLPGHWTSRSLAVGGSRSVRWFKDTICTRRGMFRLGPVILRTGDPFGLFSVDLDYAKSVPVLVLPQVVPLPSVQIAAGGRAGEGRFRNTTLEHTVSAAAVRPFQPGDYHRWIHWPTSARRNELFVRTFDAAPAGDLWIVIDAEGGVHHGQDQESSIEHSVILAASLADRYLLSGRAVGLAAAGQELIWLPPRGGEAQRWRVLYSLALLEVSTVSLADLLARMSRALGRQSSVVVLTPDPDRAWVEQAALLMRRGVTPTVFLMDPTSFGGAGDVRPIQSLLAGLGVTHSLITSDFLEGATVEEFAKTREYGDARTGELQRRSREAWRVVL